MITPQACARLELQQPDEDLLKGNGLEKLSQTYFLLLIKR